MAPAMSPAKVFEVTRHHDIDSRDRGYRNMSCVVIGSPGHNLRPQILIVQLACRVFVIGQPLRDFKPKLFLLR
jgi:hypothetical protein